LVNYKGQTILKVLNYTKFNNNNEED
jgi:hypothetical protein